MRWPPGVGGVGGGGMEGMGESIIKRILKFSDYSIIAFSSVRAGWWWCCQCH